MISQKDLGTSLLFFALFVVLLWVATGRATYLVVGPAAVRGRRRVRPQPVRARAGPRRHLARPVGRPEGRRLPDRARRSSPSPPAGSPAPGIGLGSPTRIPLAETDFIFAAIGEELGLVGATAVLLAYLLHHRRRPAHRPAHRGALRAAARHRSDHCCIGVQSFIIIAGVIRVLPLTGVTLPFVSYGGSSLVANYVLLALLLRISDDTPRQREEAR